MNDSITRQNSYFNLEQMHGYGNDDNQPDRAEQNESHIEKERIHECRSPSVTS